MSGLPAPRRSRRPMRLALRRRVLTPTLVLCSASVSLGQNQPRLSALIADLGSEAGSLTVSSTGLVFFQSAEGMRCYDPVRRTSFVVDSAPSTDVAVSPNGTQLAFARGDPIFAIWSLRIDPSTGRPIGQPRRLSVRTGRAPAFSPDGRWVAFSVLPAGDTIVGPRIVRVPAGGGPEQVLSRAAGFAQALRWSPDARWLYYRHGMMTPNGQLRTLRRVAVTGGRSRQLARIGEFVGVSPDGSRLAYITNIHFHRDPGPKHVVIADAVGHTVSTFDLPADVMPIAWGPRANELLLHRFASPGAPAVREANLAGRIRDLTPAGRSEELMGVSANGTVIVRQATNAGYSMLSVDASSGNRHVLFNSPISEIPVWLASNVVGVLHGDTLARIVALGAKGDRSQGAAACPQWLGIRPDSTVLCMQSAIGSRDIRSLDLGTGVVTNLRRIYVAEEQRPQIQHTGADLLVVSYPGRILTAPVTGETTRALYSVAQGEQADASTIGMSRDGTWIALFTRVPDPRGQATYLRLVSTSTGEVRSVPVADLHVTSRPTSPPAWDPLGRFIALAVEDGHRVDVWIIPLNGDAPFAVTRGDPVGITTFIVAPDGNRVFYGALTAKGASSTALWVADLSTMPSVRSRQ